MKNRKGLIALLILLPVIACLNNEAPISEIKPDVIEGETSIVDNGDGTYTLENSQLRAVVNVNNVDYDGVGGIIHLYNKENDSTFDLVGADGVLFGIQAGNYYPNAGSAKVIGNGTLRFETETFSNSSNAIGLKASVLYKIVDNRLKVSFAFEPSEQLEFENGLDIIYNTTVWNGLSGYNHYGLDERTDFADTGRSYYNFLNNFYEFESQNQKLGILSRNPYHSFVQIDDSVSEHKVFRFRVLIASEPLKARGPPGPKLASVLPANTVLRREYEIILLRPAETIKDNLDAVAFLSPHPNGYDQVITMTFDDIPFVPGWEFPKSSTDPDAPMQRFLIKLLEDHPKMKMGWIILPDGIWYKDMITEYHKGEWWNTHGSSRLLTEAPPAFKDWLVNLENDVLVYGYEDRVHLGSHGYHHTSEMDLREDSYEFQYYDPVGHDKTFDAILEDHLGLGLTEKSLKWIRTPGFYYTRSTIDALIKHGFILYDPEIFRSKFYMTLFYSEYGRIWGVSSNWAGDGPQPYSNMQNPLTMGKICHTAGHPLNYFDAIRVPKDNESGEYYLVGDPEAYENISAIFTKVEEEFPNLGYMFPDDLGFFMDETYDIGNMEQSISPGKITFKFDGAATKNQTLVVDLSQNYQSSHLLRVPTMDGEPITRYEKRGSKVYIVLPRALDGKHEVVIPFREISNLRPELDAIVRKAEIIDDLKLSKNKTKRGEGIGVSYEVRNTGNVILKGRLEIHDETDKLLFNTYPIMNYTLKPNETLRYEYNFTVGKDAPIGKFWIWRGMWEENLRTWAAPYNKGGKGEGAYVEIVS